MKAIMSRRVVFFLLLLNVLLVLPGFAQSPFKESSAVKIDKSVQVKEPDLSFMQKIAGRFAAIVRRIKAELAKIRSKTANSDFIAAKHPIPGLETKHFVCQGICYLPLRVISPASNQPLQHSSDHALIAYYPIKGETDLPSQIVAVSLKTGKPVVRFELYESESRAYKGHAGGITVAGEFLWVSSGYRLFGFDLNEMIEFAAQPGSRASFDSSRLPASFDLPVKKLVAREIFAVDSKASSVSFCGEYLWVGSFVRVSNKKYAPIDHHTQNPWNLKTMISGYKVNKRGYPTSRQRYDYLVGSSIKSGHQPDKVIFCRQNLQGFAVCRDVVALSLSFGPANSKLALYQNPLKEPGRQIFLKPSGLAKGYSVEAWFLAGEENWLTTATLPAGSEDIEFDGKHIYIAFEGASEYYRRRWKLRNPFIKIDSNFYLIDPTQISRDNSLSD